MAAAQGPGVGGTTGALDEVAGLVSRWRRARGSMDRVRVIASGARTLGAMSPDDRRVLAQAVAERGAPEIADRLGPPGGGGPSSSELTELTRALLSVDRAELDGLATSLGDPDERRRLLLAATGAVAAPPDGADPPPPPSGAAVALPPPADVPRDEVTGRPRRTAPAVPPLRESPELTSTPLGTADLGAADLGTADLGAADLGAADLGAAGLGAAGLGAADLAPSARGAAPPTGDTEREAGPAGRPTPVAPVRHPARRPSGSDRPTAGPPRTPPPEPGPRFGAGSRTSPGTSRETGSETGPGTGSETARGPALGTEPRPGPVARVGGSAPSVGEVLDTIGRATSARERLRAVARLEGTPIGGDHLVSLLEQVPDGWQRRTAALRLVAAGGVASPDPRRTVGALARDSDRIAVAGALVDAGLADAEDVAGTIPDRAVDRLRRRTGR